MSRKKGSGVQSAKIEQIPTADLIPYARNSRTHSDEQVAQIALAVSYASGSRASFGKNIFVESHRHAASSRHFMRSAYLSPTAK